MGWELAIALTVISVFVIFLLVRYARTVGGSKNEIKARKIQQIKAAAADEIQATPLRTGRDLVRKLRAYANRW